LIYLHKALIQELEISAMRKIAARLCFAKCQQLDYKNSFTGFPPQDHEQPLNYHSNNSKEFE